MARYTIGVRTPAAATNAAYTDLRTGATRRVNVLELAIFSTAATATSLGLVRPATLGTASTTAAPQPSNPADPASGSLVGTAWSAAPTIAATPVYLRRAQLVAAIGAGMVWPFAPGELWVSTASSLLLWNFGAAAGAALDVYLTIEE